MNIADLRIEYKRGELDEEHAHADPIAQFSLWWDEASAAQVREANAMTLATADADGKPSARTVLLKGFDQSGFVFFTNYDSRKGKELAANARAALLFFWPELERQVRIDGTVERTTSQESDEYFRSRPLASRIGAWASPQSQADPRQDVADGARGRDGTAPCGSAKPAALLGRLSRRSRCHRILAGTAVTATRSAALCEGDRVNGAGWTRTRLAP